MSTTFCKFYLKYFEWVRMGAEPGVQAWVQFLAKKVRMDYKSRYGAGIGTDRCGSASRGQVRVDAGGTGTDRCG